MKTVTTVAALRQQVSEWKKAGQRIALVPTMGNLHQGHLSLVEKANSVADKVVVSIFVNPLQFDDKQDLSAYPRTEREDQEKLAQAVCDVVFIPSTDDVYPNGMTAQTQIIVPGADDILCGARRPGHFAGVATVVNKLFNLVQPDIAIFGEKDYQQLWVIAKMAADLNLPIEIIGGEIYREKSGLAMSSRNQYLTDSEHTQAADLYQILRNVKAQLEMGRKDFSEIESEAIKDLAEKGFEPDYIEIRRASDLALPNVDDTDLRVLAAAKIGKARLIDNIAVTGYNQ